MSDADLNSVFENGFFQDVDVRPVAVDRLVQFTQQALQQRRDRIATLLSTYQDRAESTRELLQRTEKMVDFLSLEQENAVLAQELQAGNIVRVVCPQCKGSGMKPMDVLSGRLQNQGSAFESRQAPNLVQMKIDPALQCETCEGKRWVLMERFKG